MKPTLTVLLLSLAVACGSEPEAAKPVLVTGSYGVTFDNDAMAAYADDDVVAAANALEAIFAPADVAKALAGIHIVQDETLPAMADAVSSGGTVRVKVDQYPCAGKGSIAHELAHLVRERITGDGDGAHTDTRLFFWNCTTNACVWASVEMAGRPLCAHDNFGSGEP